MHSQYKCAHANSYPRSLAPSVRNEPGEYEKDESTDSLGEVIDRAIETYRNPDPKKLAKLPLFAAAADNGDAGTQKNGGTSAVQTISSVVPPQRRNPLQKPRKTPRVSQAAVVGQDGGGLGRAVTGEDE
jgi:hypothetical protein